jgi:hypothetical protein
MHVPQSRDHKFFGAIDHLIGSRYRNLLRSADSRNVVSANEDRHVLLWLAYSWINDGDMCKRQASRLCEDYARKT